MIDGGNYKDGVGERLGRIVVANEGAVPAVRDDDERQLVATDWTILYSGERDVAEDDLARRFGAVIPHRSFEGRTVRIGEHVNELKIGSVSERRRETEGDRDELSGGQHQRASSHRAGRAETRSTFR